MRIIRFAMRGHGKVRALGMGLAMQGSRISGLDVGSAALKLNDEGFQHYANCGTAGIGNRL